MDILVLVAALGSVDDNGIAVGITPNGGHLRPTVGAKRAEVGISALDEEITELIGNRFGHHILRGGSPQIRLPKAGVFAVTASFSIGRVRAFPTLGASTLGPPIGEATVTLDIDGRAVINDELASFSANREL